MAQRSRALPLLLATLLLLVLLVLSPFPPSVRDPLRSVSRSVGRWLDSSSASSWTSHREKEEADGAIPLKFKREGTHYLLGVGKADITGPVVELNFAGYADQKQVGTGVRQRVYARTFIIGSTEDKTERLVYTVLDAQSGDTAVRYGVLEGLKRLGKEYDVYGQRNVAIVGTHSHSGPGAWFNYLCANLKEGFPLVPSITSLGFNNQSYRAIVDGAVLSIERAHRSLALGTLSYGTTEVHNANVNRSPYAYLANPSKERAKYQYNVDKELQMLKFSRASDGKAMGILNWFPVHGTSLYGNNTLVTGDNKGIAADLFEKSVRGASHATANFVAGFSQANVGDTSPNILGAYCDDGKKCSFKHSLCNGKADGCHGRGPDFHLQDQGQTSGLTIGTRQFEAAKRLYDSWDASSTDVTGGAVRSFHTFQDMQYFRFKLPNGTEVQTCPAALGYGFAAGTTDWPGYFDFEQGDNSTSDANPLWLAVRAAIRQPTQKQIDCQGKKPILLDVGEIHTPYDWTPNIVDIQVLRVGQLFIIVSPGEATTMSGRRWRNAITDEASRLALTGSTRPIAVVGAPANSYSHYIATEEEYQIQRYEGASTLYGPNTLNAYLHLTTKYLPYLSSQPPKRKLPAGPSPPNNVGRELSFIQPVVFDSPGFGHSFGDVIDDAPASSSPGRTVTASFVGANPRNDLRLEGTYAFVEQKVGGSWRKVKDDSDYDLIFRWQRTSTALGTSKVTIEWMVPRATKSGTYRIGYNGASKAPLTGSVNQFGGTSRAFAVG